MKLSDFNFSLPDKLIAYRPRSPRSSSRLMYSNKGKISDLHVSDLSNILNQNDLLVLNDTKVFHARLFGKRIRDGSCARIEVTLLKEEVDGAWSSLIKPLRKIKLDEVVSFEGGLSATLVGKQNGQGLLKFNVDRVMLYSILSVIGAVPLPPYIERKRKADDQDKLDYQTIFAKKIGAVAAPTASLHFDELMMCKLSERGVRIAFVTLHVGAGTFLPVKVENVKNHKMHSEWGEINNETVGLIRETKSRGGRVIPIGTTSLRLIEAAAQKSGNIEVWSGDTDIFIYPGFDFKVADALMTNFHLPGSTLLMLVSAFVGQAKAREIYEYAIQEKYRFFSYGDASFLVP